jgi:hypothetical protein
LVVVGVAGLLFALLNVPPAVAQPANDDFDSATVISALPFSDSVSTSEATTAFDDPFCDGNDHSVWYSFTPTQDATIRADAFGSDYNPSLSVYTGSRGALSQIACESFSGQVTFAVTANTTYFFMVASVSGNPGGTLVFNVTGPPQNDELGGATPLTLNTTVTQDTNLATSAPTDPTDCALGLSFSNTVWFSFTATQSQPLNLDKRGTDYRSSLTVLTDLGSGPVVIACVIDTEGPPAPPFPGVRFDAVAGKTYFFMAAAVFTFGQGGLLQLTLRPAIVATVGIDPTGTVDRQGVAVATGTLGCSQGVAGASLHVVLRQRISKTLVITGSRDLTNLQCPTTPDSWSATIIGDNGPFRKGRAEVLVTGRACDPIGCDTPEVRQLVDLRRK